MKRAFTLMFLLLLPTLMLIELIDLNSSTGNIVNDLATLRLERVTIARSPFSGNMNAECRAYVRTIDQYLRMGADERYYTPNGLVTNPVFAVSKPYFTNERTLFTQLIAMRSASSPCSPQLQEQSVTVQQEVADLNIRLGNETMQHNKCTGDAQWYFDQAAFLSTPDPVASMNYLEKALSLC